MSPRPRSQALSLALFFLLHNIAMLACLRQWGSPHPWSRHDRFSGGYILLSILWLAISFRFLRLYASRNEISSELSGSSFDPILLAAGALWLFWTDRYLITHFSGDMSQRGLLEGGPYRIVRHPRYLSLIVSHVAFALALASVLSWALLPVWLVFILRRARLEEAHRRKLFGADYAAYSRRTARLIPSVY
jgi:protein-S-isoprenylcysteine O-methyltransferase Ste14